MRRLFLIFVCFGLCYTSSQAELITVSGDVYGIWSADTVLVIDLIQVPPDSILIIEPGVKVLFWGMLHLYVQSGATLTAIGTETDSILFDSYVPGTFWKGLAFVGASDSSTLEFCRVSHGTSAFLSSYYAGGGISCDKSSPTITHCLIDNCVTPRSGGAIYCDSSNARIIGNVLVNNSAAYNGGGIDCYYSSPEIVENVISQNQAGLGGGVCSYAASSPLILDNLIVDNDAYSKGGGVYFSGATSAIVKGNDISQNVADYGAGIYCLYSGPTLEENILENNVSSLKGGGIFCDQGANPTIVKNLLTGNQATHGGAVRCQYSSPEISHNTISGNQAWYGGGISLAHEADPVLNNNLIVGNQAENYGGGVHLAVCSPTFINNTICDNDAVWGGGGVRCYSYARPILVNCIFWGNAAAADSQISTFWSSDPILSYCDVQGGWGGIGNLDVDPSFVPGPLSTYHLSSDSPCIDSGNPEPEYDDPEDPQNPGFALWPAQGILRNDMGAYGGGGAAGWLTAPTIRAFDPVPTEIALEQNYPNPFNPMTTIPFTLSRSSRVSLQIFNLQGRHVCTLLENRLAPGRYEISFDGGQFASGVYIYRLRADQLAFSGKMILLK